ncbi:XrtA-associated tyrosine autokinase [Nitrosococcus wardiae]|uniref:non-specific protein-tyrosine kinase n=1 Tax=Nitrosococcus wardiae TaxID=1814290 RepID=A0A4P7C129_9GAMM|nr:XrtA-associated tyrosine autokinase [Nitrosococcus wardiae]QBQ54476.1 tyrosine-protein kinase family protein [Nitrosococcus wardiae]
MDSIEKAMQRMDAGLGEEVSAGDKSSPFRSMKRGITEDTPTHEAPSKSRSKTLQLDLEMLRTRGFVTPDLPRSRAAEEYRLLKRPILKRALGHKLAPESERSNLIMVTSAVAGEGKTFNTFNLAMSMVMEYDHTVLLIDADLLKPQLTRTLGLEGQRGLVDVLLHPELDLGEVMIRTDIPNFSVVPAGQSHSRTTELLASQQMDKLAEEISRRYPERIVIFDTSPLLATSQPSVLAHIVGQIVLVVEAEHTPQRAVVEALSLLDRSKPIWMVLNKSRELFGSGTSDRYYYYGYS